MLQSKSSSTTIIRTFFALAFFASVASVNVASATDFFVSSANDIDSALRDAGPGDTLIMTNGTWTISGQWLVVNGLNFVGGSINSGNVVEFRGGEGEAFNCRFTNSAIVDYNPSDIDTRYFWCSMYGRFNRVDHNFFSGQDHSGVTVVVWRNDSGPDNHLIDNNYFADRPLPVGASSNNGYESIRVGTSTQSLSSSFTTVEYNLFERTDSEIEIISNKSSNNIIQYNTFRDASGTLTLRQGDDNLVDGNFFLGEGKAGSGGVRIVGERQTVINNYFNDLDGRAGGAISISGGRVNTPLNGQ